MAKNKKITLIIVFILIIALPLFLLGIKQTLDGRTRAAAADKLEAEDGVLGGNAIAKQDSNASGGSYIELGINSGFSITQGPTVTNITDTSATITWYLSEVATGQVEYGITTSYGTPSTPENSFNWDHHAQTLSGLNPNTTYHYRVKSTNQAGITITSNDQTFTTPGTTSSPTPLPPTSQLDLNENPNIYGVGLGVDSKNNYPINASSVSHRFIASTTSKLNAVVWQLRGGINEDGSKYSDGNGGKLRISVQTNNNGLPSGTILSSVDYIPGNPTGGFFITSNFANPPTLNRGQTYHIVWQNIDASPNTNWISINELFTYNSTTPRQPALNDNYAVLYKTSSWQVMLRDTADMDLIYADGTHDGQAYSLSRCDIEGTVGLISGGNIVRENFTVSGGDKTVTKAWVRMKKISGSSNLTVKLLKNDGTILDEKSISAASIGVKNQGCTGEYREWVSIAFSSPQKLLNNSTYNLVLSTASDTKYIMTPIQIDNGSPMLSRRFKDGKGQYSANNGTSWNDFYEWAPFAPNMQFYFTLQ